MNPSHNKQTLFMLFAAAIFMLLPLFVPIAGAQDAVGTIEEGLRTTEISLMNPLTGEGTTVTLLRVLYVLAGVLLLFVGWRAYKIALATIGFVVGSSIGASLAANAGFGTALTLVSSVLMGVVGIMLATFAYYVAIVLFGGYIGYLLTANIVAWAGLSLAGNTFLLVLIIGAVLGAALALALSFELIVVLTAYMGAVILVSGLGLVNSANGFLWLIGLFILGLVVQAAIARSQNERVFRRRRYAS